MPIRTSIVVAGGIALLALVGVTTIFGNSIVAMVAPPPAEGNSAAPETSRNQTGGTAPADSKQTPSPASAGATRPTPTSKAIPDAG